MKNECNELPTSPHNSKTPLKSWTIELRERKSLYSPHLFTLSPRPLSLFPLSCPLWVQHLCANEPRTNNPLSLHLNVRTILSFSFIFVFSHLTSHLCLLLLLSYPISTHRPHLPIQCHPVYPILSLPHSPSLLIIHIHSHVLQHIQPHPVLYPPSNPFTPPMSSSLNNLIPIYSHFSNHWMVDQ